MKGNDFTTTIVVDQSPQVVFDAITHPGKWWSGSVEGNASGLNDEFIYRYNDLHMSNQNLHSSDFQYFTTT